MKNWILHPNFLHFVALQKPKTRQFGKVKCSPYTSRLYKGAEAMRESSVGRSCLSFGLASIYSYPTQNSSKSDIGQTGTGADRWKEIYFGADTEWNGFLHKMKNQNELKGLIKTLAFLSMSDFLVLFYSKIFNMLHLYLFWTWDFIS